MPKKITKPKKQGFFNKIDSFFDDLITILWKLEPGHIAFLSGAMFLLWIIIQLAFVSNFLWENSNYFSFMTLDNTLLFSFLFVSVFIIWAIFPPFFIFALISIIFTNDLEYQKYIMFGWVIIWIIWLFFEWYRKFFKKYSKIIFIIYIMLFLIWSFIYYYKVLNTKTPVEIVTSDNSFQAKLAFSNWDYYFVEKDWKKIILNSRDVKSIKILHTGEYQINICNNTNTIFNEINLHYWLNYSELKPGECSEYKERKELYKLVPMAIFTMEDGVDTRYTMFPTDYVGEELYPSGKYTIEINNLLKENKTIEYNGGIDFEIK